MRKIRAHAANSIEKKIDGKEGLTVCSRYIDVRVASKRVAGSGKNKNERMYIWQCTQQH